MAKIALELERALAQREAAGAAGAQHGRLLARGDSWLAEDVICTCGPRDRSFEERHAWASIAIVVAGSFQYRADSPSGAAPQLMAPGSLLLGNPNQYFECGHAHGEGDRCISFRYAPEFFEELAREAGVSAAKSRFVAARLPPVPTLSPVIGRACAALVQANTHSWEELGIQLAVETLRSSATVRAAVDVSRDSLARVTQIVRAIERRPDGSLTVDALARRAELSRYHFLRTFERVTGVTPHQYVLRARLRDAAMRLLTERSSVLDVAFDSGFRDVSNFNRAFRAEFGTAPRGFRRSAERWSGSESDRELAPRNGTPMDRDDPVDGEP